MRIGEVDLGDYPIILAPMEDITDPPFRLICKELGASAVVTEFIAAEGLIRDIDKSLQKLQFSERERPIGIQLFGNNIDSMVRAAKVAEAANPDFIDLNFGCPVRKIVNKGGGAALLQDVPLLLQITKEVVKAVKKPVTVKTRLGWDEKSIIILQLAQQLQDIGISALTVHARTRSQMYGGKADWTLIGELKNMSSITMPIIGNGDITDIDSAFNARHKYGVDGVMIGRAAIGNPWIFREISHFINNGERLPKPSLSERVAVCKHHLEESIKYKGEQSSLLEIRRHYAQYFKGLPDFKPFRMKLMEAQTFEAVKSVLHEIDETF